MEYSIAYVLYEWMHQRRIVSAVAQAMGMSGSTLSAKLRPNATQSRLAADELAPLCAAIREIGYGSQLDGILHGFMKALGGQESAKVSDSAMVPQVLALAKGVGVLSECADRISKLDDPVELQKLCTMVRTEILPVVLQTESLLLRRIEKVQKHKRVAIVVPVEAAEPQVAIEGVS